MALKRENSKLTAVVRKKDTEIEATALASLRMRLEAWFRIQNRREVFSPFGLLMGLALCFV